MRYFYKQAARRDEERVVGMLFLSKKAELEHLYLFTI